MMLDELKIKSGYKMDVVFCIDVTGCISRCVCELKDNAKDFPKLLNDRFNAGCHSIDELRVKVITFRDFASEGEDAIDDKTPFYDLFDPYALGQFEEIIKSLESGGGGDEPESALEAMVCAMQSDWVKLSATDKGRHIIVVLTDAPPLKPGDRAGCDGMDVTKYPQTLRDFIDMYEGKSQQFTNNMKGNARRLIVFGPTKSYVNFDGIEFGWETVFEELSDSSINNDACKLWFTPVESSRRMNEISIEMIINDIYFSAVG